MNLLDLNHDCLVHIATFLDAYTLAYVVALVCKALHGLANHPAVWALNIVAPCCEKQLLVLARKHSAIRRVVYRAPPELVETVVSSCPKIEHWHGLFRAVPDIELQLVAFYAFGNLYPPKASYMSLRELSFTWHTDVCFETISTNCPNVVKLTCSRLTPSAPTAFPNLTYFSALGEVLTDENWRAFVRSHPHLQSVLMFYSGCGDPNVMPSGLRRLHLHSSQSTTSAFARALLAANIDSVQDVCWMCGLDPEVITLLAKCPNLLEAHIDFVPLDVGVEGLISFATAANLERLSLPRYSPVPEDVVEALAHCLKSRARRLDPWLMSSPAAVGVISASLATVTTVEIPEGVSLDSCRILGDGLNHLRHAQVECSNFTLEMADALAPAFRWLIDVTFDGCPPEMAPLAAAVGCSDKLVEVSFRYRSGLHNSTAITAFLSTWGDRELRRLCLTDVPTNVLQVVSAALLGRIILVRHVTVIPGKLDGERSVFDDFACPCASA